jgi:hypothetical protein
MLYMVAVAAAVVNLAHQAVAVTVAEEEVLERLE